MYVFFYLLLMFSFVLPLHGSSVAVLSDQDLAHFSVVNDHITHTGTDACVCKITDGINIFILKQIHDPSLDEQFLLINDAVASTIGCCAGIAVNEVSFVPYNVASHLKIYPERAATLHRYVVGKDLDLMFPEFLSADFTLQQRVINVQSPWQKKYPLAYNCQGLTRTIIESMSINELLPCLCAFDTFVGNSDRSFPNIFYDPIDSRFCGIDQAAAFSKDLPLLACYRIKDLMREGYFKNCFSGVIDSVRVYRNMLHQLYVNNQPDSTVDSMQQLIPYLAADALGSSIIQDRLNGHSAIIAYNYFFVLQLIQLLDDAIHQYFAYILHVKKGAF